MFEIISSATNNTQGITTYQARNQPIPLTSQKKTGTKASPAPAGAGTPVLNPADLCGCSAASIQALKRARRSAQQTANASPAVQPNFGASWSDQRNRISAGEVPNAILSLSESSSAPN